MRPELRIQERLAALQRADLYRDPARADEDAAGAPAAVDARSNDYLGLGSGTVSRETVLAPGGFSREARPGVRVGAGAARLISGTTREHLQLESELARWLGTEACLLFSSAYAANLGTLSALAVGGDVLFSDALNHASIIDGCRLSRAEVVVVPHRDLDALAAALRARAGDGGTHWVVTESYFGMDGTSPDLAGLRTLCDLYEAALIVDEAHALGVFGEEGRGLAARAGIRADVVVGGLGKAFGLQGGFVASSGAVHRWLWNRARSFVFSTAPSPWLCERAREHLVRVRQADADRSRLAGLGERLDAQLSGAGVRLPAGRHGPIFPVIFGSEGAALAAAAALRPLGVLGQAIRPPTVPAGTARLRVTLRADMTPTEVDTLGAALVRVWRDRAARAGGEPRGPRAEPGAAQPAAGTSGAQPSAAVVEGQVRWVVLGTGTGVGKTFVAEGLVRALAATGQAVAGLKPVETGCRTNPDGQPIEGDAARLEAASFHVKHPRPHPLYGFREPLAPSLAARREGQLIEAEVVTSWIDRVRSTAPGPPTLVVETAGGVFSPLTENLTNFDLALCLGLARWILVAPDRLGVLHDLTSTLRAMTSLGRAPDCVVLSAPLEPDASTGTNASELRRLGVMLPVVAVRANDTSALHAILSPSGTT